MARTFLQMLEEGRRAKGITLRKLGQLVDLSPSFLSDMENGRRNPPKDEGKINDIALVLGLNSKKFLEAAKIERLKDNIMTPASIKGVELRR
jgi:transcriptional regulator with XRE-family HTH domain